MPLENEKRDEHSTDPEAVREAEIANRLYEKALTEGGEVEIKEGETWGS